jgi:hypothetical protein
MRSFVDSFVIFSYAAKLAPYNTKPTIYILLDLESIVLTIDILIKPIFAMHFPTFKKPLENTIMLQKQVI